MYEKRTLPNGVRMVYEHMPHVRSAAIGVWIGVGSRYESPSDAGSAHFIEHMLFKGTAQHTASELAEHMDAIGGQVNAYTTREGTCYYARVLDEHLDRAGDLLAEMLFTSNFAEADVANECGVIREEMDMYADTPEDLAAIFQAQRDLGLKTGMLVTNPIPQQYAMDKAVIDKAIDQALAESHEQGIHGKETTPFLLARVAELTGGDSLESNIQLVLNNARVAAKTAVALCK